MPDAPLCRCGCGEVVRFAPRTDAAKGWIKGEPLAYVRGHARRSSPHEFLVEESGCWIWQRAIRSADGYGQAYVDGRPRLAHRAVFERHRGPIPTGKVLDHLCRNRACVNPDHLEIVTIAENCRRGARARLTPAAVAVIRDSSKTDRELAVEMGIGKSTVHAARSGVSWGTR